jgi:hypothetical protein
LVAAYSLINPEHELLQTLGHDGSNGCVYTASKLSRPGSVPATK